MIDLLKKLFLHPKSINVTVCYVSAIDGLHKTTYHEYPPEVWAKVEKTYIKHFQCQVTPVF